MTELTGLTGVEEPAYAAESRIEAARSFLLARSVVPTGSLAMARTSLSSEQIAAILEDRRNRKPWPRRHIALWILGSIATSLPLAAITQSVSSPPAILAAPATAAAHESVQAAAPAGTASEVKGTMRISTTTYSPAEGHFTQPRFHDRCEPGSLTGRSHRTDVRKSGDRWKIVVSFAGCTLRIQLDGEIRFYEDESDIEGMGRGAHLVIEEDAGSKRKLVVTAGPAGDPRYRWSVDGRDLAFENEARRWLAGVLPEIFRTSGLQARERVKKIFKSGGVPAILEETRKISSSRVRVFYFVEALRLHPLQLEEVEALLRGASASLGAGQDLAVALSALPTHMLEDPRIRRAFVGAALGIRSDHEASRLLMAFLDRRDLTPKAVDALMSIAPNIGSDHEVVAFLTAVLHATPAEGPPQTGFFVVVDSIGSDLEKRRALQAVIDRGSLDEATVRAVLRSVQGIRSDAEAASLLVELARSVRIEGPLREPYIEVADNLGSQAERGRALTALKPVEGSH